MATLIFDLDGTILDVRPRHFAVYADIMRELGQPPLSAAEYWRRRREGEGTISIAGALPGFEAAWLEKIESREYMAIDRPYDGALDVLRELGRCHRLLLVTLRRDAEALAWQLSESGLSGFFAEVVSPANQIPARKSELLPYWLPLGETWVIGDSEADLELAADLGAKCVCLSEGVRSAKFLREAGAPVIASSLRELPVILDRGSSPAAGGERVAPRYAVSRRSGRVTSAPILAACASRFRSIRWNSSSGAGRPIR